MPRSNVRRPTTRNMAGPYSIPKYFAQRRYNSQYWRESDFSIEHPNLSWISEIENLRNQDLDAKLARRARKFRFENLGPENQTRIEETATHKPEQLALDTYHNQSGSTHSEDTVESDEEEDTDWEQTDTDCEESDEEIGEDRNNGNDGSDIEQLDRTSSHEPEERQKGLGVNDEESATNHLSGNADRQGQTSDDISGNSDSDGPYIDIVLMDKTIRLSTRSLDSSARKYLKDGILMLANPSVKKALGSHYEKVCQSIQSLPPVSDFFKKALEVCQCLLGDPYTRPAFPVGYEKSEDNLALFDWMCTAISHIRKHWAKLKVHCGTHGEGFSDSNLWSVLLDFTFLGSETISCDRRELSAGVLDLNFRHDGIIRGEDSTILGLIEAKPHRPTTSVKPKACDGVDYARDCSAKTAFSLSRILCSIDRSDVALTGIFCRGFKFTVIRGQKFGDICLFREYKQAVKLENLNDVLTLCWKLKLGYEHADRLLQEIPNSPSLDDI